MNAKNLLFLIIGVIVGALATYLILSSNSGVTTDEKIDNIESVEYQDNDTDCRSFDIGSSLNEYIEFYINDDDFYVLPNPLIKYQGGCKWHIKIVRQSREFSGIKHTNFIEATIIGDKIHWEPIN